MAIPKTLTVSELFGEDDFYSIPTYQRQYKWSTKDCNYLWEDIMKVYLADVEVTEHYLGTIILDAPNDNEQKSQTESGLKKYSVVDGQQRLTTLSILIRALEKQVKTLLLLNKEDEDLNEEKERLNRVLRFSPSRRKYIQGHTGRIKLQVADDLVLRDLLAENENIDKESKIYAAFKIFDDLLHQNLSIQSTFENKKKFLIDFRSVLFSNVNLIKITAVKQSEVHSIFESLNNRGVDLDEIDLIKNYLLMQMGEKSTDFYEKYWSGLDDKWWNESSFYKVSETKLSTCFYWFLKQYPYLNKTQNSQITIPPLDKSPSKMYKNFVLHVELLSRNENLSRQEAIEKLVSDFSAITENYRRSYTFRVNKQSPYISLDSKIESAKRQRLEEFIDRVCGSPVSWSVVLWCFKNEKYISDQDYIDILRIFETFIIRKRIVNKDNWPNAVIEFIVAMNKVEPKESKKALIRRMVTAIQNNSKDYAIPTDEQVINALMNNPINEPVDRLARTILYALEEETTDRIKNDKTQRRLSRIYENFNGKPTAPFEVEHILPQKWEKYWPLEEANLSKTLRRKEHTNFIGNLLLLTPPTNNKVSNFDFDIKKEKYYNDLSSVHLVKEFLAEDFKNWDEESIRLRSMSLAKKVILIWHVDFIDFSTITLKVKESIANISDVYDREEFFLKTEDNRWLKCTFELGNSNQTMIGVQGSNKKYTNIRKLFIENRVLGRGAKKDYWERAFIMPIDDPNYSVKYYLSNSSDYTIDDSTGDF